MPGAASGMKWLGTIMPALPNEQPSRRAAPALEHGDAMPAPRAVVRDAQPDDAAADDDDALAHRLIARMPQQNGIALVEQQRGFGGDDARCR